MVQEAGVGVGKGSETLQGGTEGTEEAVRTATWRSRWLPGTACAAVSSAEVPAQPRAYRVPLPVVALHFAFEPQLFPVCPQSKDQTSL